MRAPLLLIAALATLVATPSLAQAPTRGFDRYAAIVEAYRTGTDGAVADIGAWTRADIAGVIGPAAAAGIRLAEAAAMLHTETAIAAATVDWTRGSMHLATADALVQSLPPSAEEFAERYYALIPTLFLANGDPDQARIWADRGLKLFEYSAPIRTASGAVEEVFAHLADPECVNGGCQAAGQAGMAQVRLAVAEREHRVALQRDPNALATHLHFARVLALEGKDQDAGAEFAIVLARGSARLTYLAHLFRGAMLARRSDLAGARAEYLAAMADGPGYQTPYVALSHLEEVAGNLPRARQLVAQLAMLPDTADPWWSYQNGGLDRDTLTWLVDYVRR